MTTLNSKELWFLTGSQHLYGKETLQQVAQHSEEIARVLNNAAVIPTQIIYKPVLTTSEEILAVIQDANANQNCVGIITWMHTFSPAKNWIAGLAALKKPLLHLHTQYNQDIPWSEIDMDFMNLNQAAHGDREFGFITSRMQVNRHVIAGYWQDPQTQDEIALWVRAACGWNEMQGMKIARFGDNMRSVAVTEGDKVEAQLRFGYQVYGYGIGDLVDVVHQVSEAEVDRLIETYAAQYEIYPELRSAGEKHAAIREAARIEAGLRQFLEAGGFKAFTTTFEDLHGLAQLPGLAVQRLMAEGYGFGAEGDWKTAALLRAMKVMSAGLSGGTSFMEDYTYHLNPAGMKVLGAHMLEVCPTIASGKPRLEVHPLSIGGKADPARLVFDASPGAAINVSIMDMGNRFRMVVNEVDVVEPDFPLPKLPVARALWLPRPNLKTATTAWIYAGGAHHTSFSQALTSNHMAAFAEMTGTEFVLIDADTALRDIKRELKWNDMSYSFAKQ